jgi:hypothetical protein
MASRSRVARSQEGSAVAAAFRPVIVPDPAAFGAARAGQHGGEQKRRQQNTHVRGPRLHKPTARPAKSLYDRLSVQPFGRLRSPGPHLARRSGLTRPIAVRRTASLRSPTGRSKSGVASLAYRPFEERRRFARLPGPRFAQPLERAPGRPSSKTSPGRSGTCYRPARRPDTCRKRRRCWPRRCGTRTAPPPRPRHRSGPCRGCGRT